MEKCPKCKQDSIVYEGHDIFSEIGDDEYWSCQNCGEEMMMFGKEE